MLLAKNGHALLLSGEPWSLNHHPAQWAAIETTTLTVFHKPGGTTSGLVLKALASAIDVYPPLNRGHPSSFRAPQKLTLHVEPRVPTVAKFRALADLWFLSPLTDFLREKGAHRPANAAVLTALGAEDSVALAWPIVVDWGHKESSAGGVVYAHILEDISERRHDASPLDELSALF
ncbi:hypothetical protein B0H17DRAFT_1218962 [Mycena rosella]|uniref:Uncharacterized protein n=1 Tax=Mycena rosella TaxID=1033263 RepID=A0AAD7FKE7_MYCRO|nr:hypothetical protein B0H17DRAFT_1218962 [Mycena rosella]